MSDGSGLPEVSVIIPCYNHARYLPCAVQSVLDQTLAGWEVIIVDDGSTDGTREAAVEFTDSRVHYIRQENRGLSSARNAGIRAARGRYLAFLDADDEWEPRFLETCHSALSATGGVAAVVTLSSFIDEDGIALPQLGGQTLRREEFRPRLLEGGFFPPHAVVVRAEAVRQAGMFDEALTSVEDWDLWLRITERSGAMQSIPEALARYRVSTNSMSTNAARMHANRMAVLAKHFGPPDGDPADWSTDKRRAFAFAYRNTSLGHLQQGDADTAWRWLSEAGNVWPPILARLDTFYELAFGDQPRGHRGNVTGLDLAAAGSQLLRRLDILVASADPTVTVQRGRAYGSAYVALGMLYDQTGEWTAARRCLARAIRHNPRLLGSLSVLRRLLKLSFGKRIAQLVRPRTGGSPMLDGDYRLGGLR